jgi:hypothetical protein
MEVEKKRQGARQQETEGKRDGCEGSVDPFYGFRSLYLLLQWRTDLRGAWCPHSPHSLPRC